MCMCPSRLVIIFVFWISDESSTCHLPAQLPLPRSQQVLFYTIFGSFTSLRSNNILQRKSHKWRCCWQNSQSLYLFIYLVTVLQLKRLKTQLHTWTLPKEMLVLYMFQDQRLTRLTVAYRLDQNSICDLRLLCYHEHLPLRALLPGDMLESDMFVPTWNGCMKCRAGRNWRGMEMFVSGTANLNSWFASLLPLIVFSLLWIIQIRWHPPSPS